MRDVHRLYLGPYKSFLVVDRKRRLIIPALYLGALAFAADAVLRFTAPPTGSSSAVGLVGFATLAVVIVQARAAKLAYQHRYESIPMSRSPALTLFILSFGISIAAFIADLSRVVASAADMVS